jgi:hypothetical protein
MSVEGSVYQMMRDMGEVKSQTIAELREQADTFARFIVNEHIHDFEEDEESGVEPFRLCSSCSTHGPFGGPTKHDPGCVVERAELFLVAGTKETP